MPQIILNGFASFFPILLLGFGASLIYRTTRFLDISFAGIITFSCYCVYLFTHEFHFILPLSVALSLALSISLAIFFHRFLFRNLTNLKNASLSLLLISLGLYLIFQNAIAMQFGNDVKILGNGMVATGYRFFEAYVTDIQLLTMLISVLLFVLVLTLLRHTWLGLSIRGVSSNFELCRILGIDSGHVTLWSVAIGVGLGSAAAILSALDTGMTPTMGFRLLMNGLIVMIVGGVGSVRGLLGGALLLATAQTLTSYYLDSKWTDAVSFLILIAFLIWKPLGFSGRRLKKIEI